jgi:hypothetical protein
MRACLLLSSLFVPVFLALSPLATLKDRSSKGLLDHSRSKIEAMNAKFGDTLWPIGSRL